jgi:pilus assembly protein FimV
LRKPAFNTFLFLATVIFTGALHAAGLGRLTLNSTLGQPFQAEIDLVAVKSEERLFLAARLASRDTFRLAHVDYSPSLSTFKTSLETRPDGRPYIKVVSTQPVVEPLLNMLIELSWPSGRLLREYAVLLPQAGTDANEAAARSSSSSSDRLPSSPGPVSGPAAMDKMERVPGKPLLETAGESKVQKGASDSISSTKANTFYGPVKRGDTLGGIVRNITLPRGISFNQMLIALKRANADAFLGNNIHQLKAGPILRIPDVREIKAIPRMEADKEVNDQTMEWNRQRSPDVISSIPPAGELKQTVSGKIAVAEADPGAAEPSREVLRLSRGEELPRNGIDISGTGYHAAASFAGTAPRQDELRMMDEDAIARSGSLLEANERIALLEKNISELQRLLELRRLALAELQKQPRATAGAAAANEGSSTEESSTDTAFQSPDEGATHSAASAPSAFSSPTLISIAGASVAEGTVGTGAMPGPDSSLVEIAGSVQAPALSRNKTDIGYLYPERVGSWIEDLTRNIEYLGGALVLLIMGIAGFSMSRRPRKMPFAQDSAGKAVDLAEFPVEDKAAAALRDRKESVEQSSMSSDSMDPMAKKAPDHPEAGSRKAGREQYDTRGVAASNLSRAPHTAQSLTLSPVLAAPASSRVPVHPAAREAYLNISDAPRPGSTAWYRQGKSTPWHEIVNKIDLARAYQEMGDRDAAGQVLEEVMREGDIQQRARAKALLSNL